MTNSTPSHAAAQGIKRAAKTSINPTPTRLRALSEATRRKPYTAMAWNRTSQYLSASVRTTIRKSA